MTLQEDTVLEFVDHGDVRFPELTSYIDRHIRYAKERGRKFDVDLHAQMTHASLKAISKSGVRIEETHPGQVIDTYALKARVPTIKLQEYDANLEDEIWDELIESAVEVLGPISVIATDALFPQMTVEDGVDQRDNNVTLNIKIITVYMQFAKVK